MTNTLKSKLKHLPKPLRQRISETVESLREVSALEARLKKLRGISEVEWKEAERESADAA